MRPKSRSAMALAAIIHLSFQSPSADAAAYNFIKIADENTVGPAGPIGELIGEWPAISGETVAFEANGGVFTGSGGPLNLIALPGDMAPGGSIGRATYVAIDGERVAFTTSFPTFAIYTGDGGPLTKIMMAGDPAPNGTFTRHWNRVGISGNRVVFQGWYQDGAGWFTGDGGPLTAIVKTGDPAPVGSFTSAFDF